MSDDAQSAGSVRAALRVDDGVVNLAGYDPASMPQAPGKRAKTEATEPATADALASLQERLYAEATAGGRRSVLLVLQGMDTSGKGGVVEHVVGSFGPSGVRVTAFKAPTDEERQHDFLWRIRKALPADGMIAVFDRSHYEDVLIQKVHQWADEDEITRRYDEINRFESELVDKGAVVVKCFLHISYDMQRERLLARLDNPSKHWKFRESDIDERALWSQYQVAYAAMLENTSTQAAPWYVIPSDRKWYRNWAVGRVLHETLADLDPQYPSTELDIDRLRERLRPPF